MTPTVEHVRTATVWLGKLADLTRAGQEPVTKSRIAEMAVLLAADFPAVQFNHVSLQAVAVQTSFFPAYRECRDLLRGFWDARARQVERLAAPSWLQPPDWMAERILEAAGNAPGPLLAAWLSGKGIDPHAPSTAALERDQGNLGWHDPARVRATVRALDGHPWRMSLGRMLATAVERHAPGNLGLLPPEFLAEAVRVAA